MPEWGKNSYCTCIPTAQMHKKIDKKEVHTLIDKLREGREERFREPVRNVLN